MAEAIKPLDPFAPPSSGGGGSGGAVTSVAGKTGDVSLTKNDVGLGNVDNTSDADKPVSTAVAAELSQKADLIGGIVPPNQLPSYVDDVIEVADYASLPSTGESGKIYITADDNKQYRWASTIYVELAGGGSGGGLTPAQEATLNSAVQPGDNVSVLVNDAGYLTSPTTLDTTYGIEAGDRTAKITVTLTNISAGIGQGDALVNANDGINEFWWVTAPAAGASILFTFDTPQAFTSVKFRQHSTPNQTHGVWFWEGSNDNVSFTRISQDFTLGGSAVSECGDLSANTTAYTYYRLTGVSGNLSQNPYVDDFSFYSEGGADSYVTLTQLTSGQVLPVSAKEYPDYATMAGDAAFKQGMFAYTRDAASGRTRVYLRLGTGQGIALIHDSNPIDVTHGLTKNTVLDNLQQNVASSAGEVVYQHYYSTTDVGSMDFQFEIAYQMSSDFTIELWENVDINNMPSTPRKITSFQKSVAANNSLDYYNDSSSITMVPNGTSPNVDEMEAGGEWVLEVRIVPQGIVSAGDYVKIFNTSFYRY